MQLENETPVPFDFGFLRASQIAAQIVPVSRATLWRWVAEGKFPQPVKIGPGVTAWHVQDVRRWCHEQAVGVAK